MLRQTNFHRLVSLPFSGLIQYHLEKNDHALTESYLNLSYITLSGARDFRFEAVSNLVAKLSFLLPLYQTLKKLKRATYKTP